MKSNTAKGWGTKGSKFWMQMVASTPKMETHFFSLIKNAEGIEAASFENCEWISPLASKDFEEYSLKDIDIENILGEARTSAGLWKVWPGEQEKEFWPDQQPQWDGILVREEGNQKTIYIIEAKAYPEEMHTEIGVHTNNDEKENALSKKVKSKGENSYDMRKSSLKYTYDAVASGGSFYLWYGKNATGERIDAKGTTLAPRKRRGKDDYERPYHSYYQLGNRLTFLHYLKEEGYNAKLVLLNFINDYTHGMDQGRLAGIKKGTETTDAKGIWNESYCDAWRQMVGLNAAPEDVLVIDYDLCEVFSNLRLVYDKETDAKTHDLTKYFKYKESEDGPEFEGCFVIDDSGFHCYRDESKQEKILNLEKILRGE